MTCFTEEDRAAALRVVALSRGLTGDQKSCAAALLLTCDGIKGATLLSHGQMSTLLDLSDHVARRATDHLIAAGLFGRMRRGGGNAASAYVPVWAEFRKMDGWWRAHLQGGGARDGGGEG